MIKKERVKGALNSLIDKKLSNLSVSERKERGALEAVAYDVADAAIILYREKIAAGLRRAGLEISDTDSFDTDAIIEAIKNKTGIDITSLNLDEIKAKVIEKLSSDLSERVGFDIDLKNGLEAGLDAAVEAAIKRGGAVVSNGVIKSNLRLLAIAQKAGVSVEEVKKVNNAAKQKRYRASAAPAVWVAR